MKRVNNKPEEPLRQFTAISYFGCLGVDPKDHCKLRHVKCVFELESIVDGKPKYRVVSEEWFPSQLE
jgi:hypothetical protein